MRTALRLYLGKVKGIVMGPFLGGTTAFMEPKLLKDLAISVLRYTNR